MSALFSLISRACIPADSLVHLASLRRQVDIRVTLVGRHAWLRWPSHEEQVVSHLLAIAGVRFFAERDGVWYAHDSRLPALDLPASEPSLPLNQLLLPPAEVRRQVEAARIEPIRVQLVPDDRPRPCTALLCSLRVLADWANQAASFEIEELQGAICKSEVLLRGEHLPHLERDRRFWGERLLLPLGSRVEPELIEADLLEAWGARLEDFVLFDGANAEIIPAIALAPLSRARVRLAARGEIR